jgi:hypothetical protein
MPAPTKTQIQMLIVSKIRANAVSSSKTLGSDLKEIYSDILDKIYGANVPFEAIESAIGADIKTNSIAGVRITGNRLKRYLDNLVYLAYLESENLPPRLQAESGLYPHLTNYSTRSDVTIGQSLRDITKLMLDKIYDNSGGPIGNTGFTYIFDFTLA